MEQLIPDFDTGDAKPAAPVNNALVNDAIAYYQVAANLFKHGELARRPEDATPVSPAEPMPAPAASSATPAPATSAAAATP
jgi:hypothetical protein